MASSDQVRAARALLNISQTELARLSGLSLPTIKRLELGASVRDANLRAVCTALEKRVMFIDANGGGPGVRLRKRKSR